MKTIILPGYSVHNREWAEEIASELKLGHEVIVHEWRHWSVEGASLSLKYELAKILKEAAEDNINIIGKSVGARIAMNVVSKIKVRVKKVILCGIASVGEDAKSVYSEALKAFPSENILCFQNTNDPFVSYLEVEKFIHSINPKIKVIEKPGSEHHYPYPEDFQKFLLN